MKTTGNRLIETLMTSILLAVTMPFSAAARITSPELDLASTWRQSKKTPTALSFTSIYTDFAKQCRTLEEPTDHNLTLLRRCPGVAGYKFLLEWDDDALTISMVNPRGKKFDLGLREMFTDVKPYADLRAKAEWRVKREHGTVVPVALIVRVDPMNDMSNKLTIPQGAQPGDRRRLLLCKQPCFDLSLAMAAICHKERHTSPMRLVSYFPMMMSANNQRRFAYQTRIYLQLVHLTAPSNERPYSRTSRLGSCDTRCGLFPSPVYLRII
jgi:hypothetical protein